MIHADVTSCYVGAILSNGEGAKQIYKCSDIPNQSPPYSSCGLKFFIHNISLPREVLDIIIIILI